MELRRKASVLPTLRWLLDLDDSTRSVAVFRAARGRRLVERRPEGESANAGRVARAIRRSGNRHGLARPGVLFGLGELMAHAVEGFDAAACVTLLKKPALRVLRGRLVLRRLLREAARRGEAVAPKRYSIETTSLDAVRESSFTLGVMQIARGRDSMRSASYGLCAVCDLALFVAPRNLGDWLRSEASHWAASAVINHMLRDARLGVEARRRLSAHLDTNVPVLQAMGMEAHMKQMASVDEAFDGVAHAARQLRRRSTSNAQAFALATIVFDRVRLLRLWALDAIVREAPPRLPGRSFVQLPSKQAHHPTLAERRRLLEMALGAQDGAPGARAALAECLLDAGFDLLAEHAPSAGLTDRQIAQLRRCFVGDPSQYYVRLAQRVPSGPWRDSIVKLAVQEFQSLLLPTHVADPFEHQPSSSEDMEERLRWFGEATRMMTVPEDRTLDRHVGLLLLPLTEAADKVFDQPYAADVRPNAYASALQRRLQGVWMALHLGHGWPDGPAPLPHLLKVAFKQADLVLQKCRGDIDDQGWQYRVVGTALALMEPGSRHDRREAWLQDDRMPPLARCMSLWSSVPMIEARTGAALELLQQALLDLNAGDAWSVASLSLELLDSSISQACRLDDSTLEDGVVRVWESCLIRWSPPWRERLRPIAAMLSRAVRGGALEREHLLDSPDFGGSRCAKLCREEAQISRSRSTG